MLCLCKFDWYQQQQQQKLTYTANLKSMDALGIPHQKKKKKRS